MANKLYLDNKDYDVPYEPSASEDEYSEEEKQILKEVRQGNKKQIDPKQQILAFDESADESDNVIEDDDIIGDSDIERGDEHDDIPDSKAWGKQRRSYYNTDFVDQDYSAYNEQEEEQAQQEEEEAKAIQLRLAKNLDEADFFLDLPKGAVDTDDDEEGSGNKSEISGEQIKLKTDLSGMTQRQKRQLFTKDSPEFSGLVADFQTHLLESQTLLDPIIEFAKTKNIDLPIITFAQAQNNMIMTYCTNVAFYLLLKAQRIAIKNHPITKRLVQLRKLLIQLQQKYDDIVKPELEGLLEKINSGEEVNIELKSSEKKPIRKLRMLKEFNKQREQSDDDEPNNKRVKLSDEEGTSTDAEDVEEDVDDEDEAERRGITYQIAKNKGLMPHRKKELRNPRVKHRNKFRKALIRRKGAVRTVRKETQRYGGEVSGIKATIKKGIKIKS